METILSSLKCTISKRSNSDSSASSSLWEKNPKSLAEEDEVLQTFNMTGDICEKLEKFLENLELGELGTWRTSFGEKRQG